MKSSGLLRLASVALLFASTAAGQPAPEPPDMTRSYDVVYTNAAGTELRLDVVQPPARRAALPAVLVIHGGAWAPATGGRGRNTTAR